MTDTVKIIVSLVAVGVPVVIALISTAWILRGRLERLEANLGSRLERVESRLGDLAAGVNGLNRQLTSMVGLLPTAFPYLHRSKAISDEEYHESMGQFMSRMAQGTESLVDHLARSMNPLTPTEAHRFRELVNKARNGEFFSREEVDEYDGLINKVQAEHPSDPGIWPLVSLGAFLLGLYLGRPKDDSQS